MHRRWLYFLTLLTAAVACQAQQTIDLRGEWRITLTDDASNALPASGSGWTSVSIPWRSAWPLHMFWLQKTVQVSSNATDPLEIVLGTLPAGQLYINGEAAGSFESGPATFPVKPGRDGRLEIAIRLWPLSAFAGSVLVAPADAGEPWLVGPEPIARNALESAAAKIERARVYGRLANAPSLVAAVLQLFLGIALIALWRVGPEYRAFFWTSAYLFLSAPLNIARFTISGKSQLVYWFGLFGLFVLTFGEAIGAAYGVRLKRWRYPFWIAIIAGGLTANPVLQPLIPASVAAALVNLPVALIFLFCLCLAFRALWSGPTAERVLGCFIVLFSISMSNRFTGIPQNFDLGGFLWYPSTILSTALGLAILVFSIRRLIADRRERLRLAGEFEAARAVQQLLFPAPEEAGIDAVYQPAQEVGGDFWQALPLENGGRLIAVGDVSGKGLKAAMVVSLVTGALRSRRSDSPGAILHELNRVVASALRAGFVTAVVARIEGGRVTIASAGHPSPYLNGAEIPLASGLPLGVDPEAGYCECQMPLAAVHQLTFVSDGVVEAVNPAGELFGFERTLSISTRSAREIADAAKAWGQNDDITVVTVRTA